MRLPVARLAIVTILEYDPVIGVPETALPSELALAEDWNG
jgi:hypothetical protein